MKALLGRKIGTTQIFKKNQVIPVTLIQAGPVQVLQLRTMEKDGYEAVQVGFETKKERKASKGKGFVHIIEFPKAGLPAQAGEIVVGDTLAVSLFQEGDKVTVSGTSKGKGFQGGVKRHGFHGRNATHGVKHEERTIGSIGMRFPQRVIKGRRMPGHMGAERITVKNLVVAHIDADKNIIALKGAVPGRKGTLLELKLS